MTSPVKSLFYAMFQMFLSGVFMTSAVFVFISNPTWTVAIVILIALYLLASSIYRVHKFNGFLVIVGEMLDSFAFYILQNEDSVNKLLSLITQTKSLEGDSIRETLFVAIDEAKRTDKPEATL